MEDTVGLVLRGSHLFFTPRAMHAAGSTQVPIAATHGTQDPLACKGWQVYVTNCVSEWFNTFIVSTRKNRVDPALANSRYTSLCLSSSIEASADFSNDTCAEARTISFEVHPQVSLHESGMNRFSANPV